MPRLNVACVVGARPNFMKMAPILRALAALPVIRTTLIHTGQHYDPALSDVFFRQLGIPKPDIDLGVGSGSQAVQTARVLEGMEKVLLEGPPGESGGRERENGGREMESGDRGIGDGGTTKDTKSTKGEKRVEVSGFRLQVAGDRERESGGGGDRSRSAGDFLGTPSPQPSPASGRGSQLPSPQPSPASGRGSQMPSPQPSPASGRGSQMPSPQPSPADGPSLSAEEDNTLPSGGSRGTSGEGAGHQRSSTLPSLTLDPPGGRVQGRMRQRYDRLIVVGDVNSTLAATLAAVKLGIPVAHVEAGLRSFDRSMPEEINRLMTDAVCDLLLVSEPSGVENLRREGHPESRIHLVGNVMIDTLRDALPKLDSAPVLAEFDVRPGEYGVVTLHRPANVDDPPTLRGILEVLAEVSRQMPLLFPVHPRTKARIEDLEAGLGGLLAEHPQLRLLAPQGYLEFLALTSNARVIVTDSGGLQEESTALGIPCLTMRPNTERPITVDEGTSTLVGSDPQKLRQRFQEVLDGSYRVGRCPELWDGRSAERIVEVVAREHGM